MGSFDTIIEMMKKMAETVAAASGHSLPVPGITHPQGSEALTGFDMVWAITENAINSQLAWLQEAGSIPGSVSLGSLDADGLIIGGSGADEALIAPPEVRFSSGDIRSAQLVIRFRAGTISYYTSFGTDATVQKQALEGWQLAFKVRLNLGQIGHDYLIHGGGKIPAEIQQLLSGFDPGQFSVQSIFLDFENSDLTTYDPDASVIRTDNDFVKKNFAKAMGAWINSHKGQDNPFILGYPVTRTSPPQDIPALLEPTGANLSLHAYEYPAGAADHSQDGLSSLNFLLVTGNRKITDEPRLFAPDAGAFHRNLVTDKACDGKAIIARSVFVEQFLRPLLITPLEQKANALPDYVHARDDRGPNVDLCNRSGASAGSQRASFVLMIQEYIGFYTMFDRSPLRGWFLGGLSEDLARHDIYGPYGHPWLYSDYVKLSWHESGFYSHDRESEQQLGYLIDLSSQPDAAGVQRPTLDIRGALYRREWDRQNTDVPPFKSNCYVGDGWATATLTWSIRLQFSAGSDGKILISKSVQQNAPATDHGDGGIFKVGDFFTDLLNLHGISDNWRDNAAGLASVETGLVQQLIDQTGAMIDNAMTRIVMPARSQFMYKNIQINADGDIELDFSYRAD